MVQGFGLKSQEIDLLIRNYLKRMMLWLVIQLRHNGYENSSQRQHNQRYPWKYKGTKLYLKTNSSKIIYTDKRAVKFIMFSFIYLFIYLFIFKNINHKEFPEEEIM